MSTSIFVSFVLKYFYPLSSLSLSKRTDLMMLFSWILSLLVVNLVHGKKSQLTPILIKEADRKTLLANIYQNKHHEIVKFFQENSLIDFSLIRFHHTDHPTIGESVHGFTPLAAAIRLCKPETAAVLGPVQNKYSWTMKMANGYSSLELCATHCPSLLKDIILSENLHILNLLLDSPTPEELFNVFRVIHLETNTLDDDVKAATAAWIQHQFDNFDIIGDPSATFWEKVSNEDNFKEFMSIWIDSKHPVKLSLLQSFLGPDTDLFKISVKKSLIAGKLVDFEDELKNPKFVNMISEILTPDNLKNMEDETKAQLNKIFETRNFEDEFRKNFKNINELAESSLSSFDSSQDKSKKKDPKPKKDPSMGEEEDPLDFTENMSSQFEAMGANAGFVGSLFSKKVLLNIFRKYLPYAYNFYNSRNPRLDTMIKLNEESFLVHETGTQKPIADKSYIESIQSAFTEDDPELIKDIFDEVEHEYSLQNQINANMHHWLPDELRIVFGPYHVTLLKAAVMLRKPNIIKYLLTRNDFNIYATSLSQLSALEMAACYNSDIFSELLGQYVTSDCNQRAKAVNHLIRMYTEKIFQKCPNGAQSAEAVFKVLLDSEGLKCFDSDKKDALAESIRSNWPISLVKAFHQTSLYKNYERYIAMAAERGDSELITYFVEKLNGKSSSQIKSALATYVKHMDPKLTQKSMADFEKMLKLKGVDINARDLQSGATALSHAAQRTIPWVVKRLLLEKDLDINKDDIVTKYNPIQHSITLFFAEKLNIDPNSEPMLIQAIKFLGKELEIPIPGFLIKMLRKNLDQMDKNLTEFKEIRLSLDQNMVDNFIENLKNDIFLMFDVDPSPFFKLQVDQFIDGFIRRKVERFINMPVVEVPLVLIQSIRELMESDILKGILMAFAPATFMFGTMIIEAIEFNYISVAKFGKKTPLELSGDNSAANGMIHNCLLSHPKIDTTLSNYLDQDTLFIVRNRAIQVQGVQKASDEMERTHFRVINKNSELEPNHLPRRIIYGAIVTLIAGSASAGFIRFML